MILYISYISILEKSTWYGPFQICCKEYFWKCHFQQTKSPGCRFWFLLSSSPKSTTVERLFYQGMFFMQHSDWSFEYWSMSPLVSRIPGAEKAKCINQSVIISYGDSLCFSSMVALKFRRTRRSASAQTNFKVSITFTNWVLIMLLFFPKVQRTEGDKHIENFVE